MHLYKSATVVDVDCNLPNLTKFEENSPVEFRAVLVNVLGEVFTKYRGIQDWRDAEQRVGLATCA